MAQQTPVSTRELGNLGAANRQVANLNQGSFQASSSSQNYANFAKNLFDVGGDLMAKGRRDAAEEDRQNKIQDDIDKKFADSEKTRLRVEAHRKLIAAGGEDYETAHEGEYLADSGVVVKKLSALKSRDGSNTGKKTSNGDVVNPVYKKEYELAYTKRKVDKFQNSLNTRAESEVKAMYAVWQQEFSKEGGEFQGMQFKDFAIEALTQKKDDWYKNELSMLPHFGEFAKDVNYHSWEKQIAVLDQGFRDEKKRNFLNDAVKDYQQEIQNIYGTDGLPKESAPQQGLADKAWPIVGRKGKKISAAGNLLDTVTGLRGKQIDGKGVERGIFTKNEVHGAFIKDFNNQVLLCDSVDCPIFKSMDAVFDSPDAHVLLNLDPNNKTDGIGKRYADLKTKADAKYVSLSNKRNANTVEENKKIKEDATKIIHNAYARSVALEIKAADGTLDTAELEELKAILADEDAYINGNLEYLDDAAKRLIELSNPNIKTTTTPLTEKEVPIVEEFVQKQLKVVDDLEELAALRTSILHGEEPSARVRMAKIKAMDQKKAALEDKEAGRKLNRDYVIEQSKLGLSNFQNADDKVTTAIRNTERGGGLKTAAIKKYTSKENVEKRKNAIRSSKTITEPGDKLTALDAIDAEVKSLQKVENDYQNGVQTTSFFNYIFSDEFDSANLTDANINVLKKKIDKITDNPTLKKSLSTKLAEISDKEHGQAALAQLGLDLKIADKSYSVFGKELNSIIADKSKGGLDRLKDLQKKYEGDEKFLKIMAKDPTKRNFLAEIIAAESTLLAKIPEEEKEAKRKIAVEGVRVSGEVKTTMQNTAQKDLLAVEKEWSQKGYDIAFGSITAKFEENQLEGAPETKNIYADDRRLLLIDRLNDAKAKGSGKIPTIGSEKFDPLLYTRYEDKISTLSGLEGKVLRDRVKKIKDELRVDYHGFNVPQQIYEDFSNELDSSIPGSPVTLNPVAHGRKTIRSAFLGRFDKFDSPEQFQELGGKEGAWLYEKVRAEFERRITDVSGKDEWKNYTQAEKLGRAEEIAGALLDTDRATDMGGMPDTNWRKRMKIYSSKWEEAQKLAEQRAGLTSLVTGSSSTVAQNDVIPQDIDYQVSLGSYPLYTKYADRNKKALIDLGM